MSETKHISLKNLQAFLKPLMRMINRKAESWEDLKNKPFGSTFAECTLTDKLKLLANEQFIALGDFYFIKGQKYTVLFDDITYNCTAYRDNYGTVNIGDITLMGESHPNSQDAPFFIFSDIDDGARIFVEDNSVDHSISITTMSENITKLPSKYVDIPKGILTEDNYLQITAGMQKGNGEVFNNYDGNSADGYMSHAEGSGTWADGGYSHAEGLSTRATGEESHAEGYATKASGDESHAEGQGTHASGQASHAEGMDTTASGNFQHVQGIQNIDDDQGKYAHIVGNGGMEANPNGGMRKYFSNAHTLDWGGNAWFSGDVYVGSTNGRYQDDGSKKLATEEYVDNSLIDLSLSSSDSVIDMKTDKGSGYTYLYADDGLLYLTIYGNTEEDLSGTDRHFQLDNHNLSSGMSWNLGYVDHYNGSIGSSTNQEYSSIVSVKPNTIYTIKRNFSNGGSIQIFGYDKLGTFVGASGDNPVLSIINGYTENIPMQAKQQSCVIKTKDDIYGLRIVVNKQSIYTNSSMWNIFEGTERPEFDYQLDYLPNNEDLYGNETAQDTYENCVFVDGRYVSRTTRRWKKIDSYNGETIPGEYVSSTGALDIGAKVIYLLNEPEVYYGDAFVLETTKCGKHNFIMRPGTAQMRYVRRAEDYLASGSTYDLSGHQITLRDSDDKIIYPTTTYDQIILADGSKWDGGIGLQMYVDEKITNIPIPDVSGQIELHNTSESAHTDIRESINELSILVGDESVATQIEKAMTVATEEQLIALLMDIDAFPAMTDKNGAVFTDKSGAILLI